MKAFGAAWNAGDTDAVGRTFAADRRRVVRGHLEAAPQRMRAFEVVGGTVALQCHPRGAYWKTATVQLRAREAMIGEEAQDEEIVWLRLQDGYWFMYSL